MLLLLIALLAASEGEEMDDFAKNLLLFALGVGLAIAIFYVWERVGSNGNCVQPPRQISISAAAGLTAEAAS